MLKVIDFKLPKDKFDQEVDMNLLAQVNHVYNSRLHVGLRNTKTRAEINRTTKKVYKQKGTGGARHGSRRANLFVGGGVVFGPRPLKRTLNLSTGMKSVARDQAFSVKARAKEVLVVSGISQIGKTKEVSDFLKSLKAKRFTFLLADKTNEIFKFFRNLTNVRTLPFANANALDILNGGTIVIDERVFEKTVNSQKVVANSEKTTKKVTKKVVKK